MSMGEPAKSLGEDVMQCLGKSICAREKASRLIGVDTLFFDCKEGEAFIGVEGCDGFFC